MFKSPVTVAICILCTLVFVLEIVLGGNVFNCSGEILLNLGASTGPLTIGQAQYGRLVSCLFLHAYLLHLILNLYVLMDFGPMAEASLGRKFYIFVFLFSGIIGALASIYYNPTQTSVGASAAILGLLGALIYKSWFAKDSAHFSRVQIVMLCTFLLYSLLLGITSDVVDNAAHLGGFFSGMFACAVYFGSNPGIIATRTRAITAALLTLTLVPALTYACNQKVSNSPDVAVFQLRKQAAPLIVSKDYPAALAKLDSAQKICGDKITSVLFDRAMVLDKMDRYDLALADIDRWLSREKDDVQALLLKSTLEHNLGKDREAITTVSKALDIKPATLLDYFNGAVKGNGGKALFYNNRAWYKLALGGAKEALADCDQSLSIDPRLSTAYDTRGVAFYLLKDYPQAEKDFSRSIALNASDIKNRKGATADGGGYYHRAIARQALGDTKGAAEDMERFKSLDYKPEPWEPKP
jgi:rhomboid protease GluP